MNSEECPPYTALAEIYDRVMAHVDYVHWAEYLAQLILTHAPSDARVLELGCGTGALTLNLAPKLGGSYLATDNSDEMLDVARSKLAYLPNVELDVLDFTSLDQEAMFDVVLLAYDGINYVADAGGLERTLAGVARMMKPDGLFFFDQSTPANSINNLSYFDEEFVSSDVSYTRSSTYDEQTRVHITRFAIEKGGSVMIEHHQQRAFTLMELLESARATEFEVVEMLTAFDDKPANNDTERIQWILRRPSSTDHRNEA